MAIIICVTLHMGRELRRRHHHCLRVYCVHADLIQRYRNTGRRVVLPRHREAVLL